MADFMDKGDDLDAATTIHNKSK